METQTIEETWEKILSSTLSAPLKLDQLLHNRIGLVNFQPENLSDRTHSAYSEALQRKHNNLNP